MGKRRDFILTMKKYIYVLYYENDAADWFFADDPRKTMSAVDLAKFITKQTNCYPRYTSEKFDEYYMEKHGVDAHMDLQYGSVQKYQKAYLDWLVEKRYSFNKLAREEGIFVNRTKLR